MSDSLITVIAIMLAAVLLLVMPVMTMASRTDDISKTDVETLTSNFVNEIRTLGKITSENYYKFIEELTSTGNTYDVEMEFKILDENPGKKSTQSVKDKIGENVYYSVFTTQVVDALESENKAYNLKEGDIVSVSVKNTNLTLSQQMKNFFYALTGNDTYTISASSSGIVLKTDNVELANISNHVGEDKDEDEDIQLLVDQIEVGDYVAYDATNNYSYTSPKGTGMSHGNGYEEKTFYSNSNIKWKVLSKNYLGTGNIVLISDEPINDELTLSGAIGYLYAEEEINRVCSIYGHGKGADVNIETEFYTGDIIEGTTRKILNGSGARSLNFNDIIQLTGFSTPDSGEVYTKEMIGLTTKTLSGYSNTTSIRTEANNFDVYTKIKYSDYLNKESDVYKTLFVDDFLIASRMQKSMETYTNYSVMVSFRDSLYYTELTETNKSNVDEFDSSNIIRPIVYLKKDVKTNGKNSNGEWRIIE